MALPDRCPVPEVRLRPASSRDAELLRQWRAEPSVRRYQPLGDLPTAQLRSDVAAQRIGELYRGHGDKFQWIVQIDGKPAGWITLLIGNWEHGLGEVGYALSSNYQGQGLMTEALALLLDDVFANTRLMRIEARCALENLGSQRVLEKNGFSREGILRSYFRLHGTRIDNYLYSLLRDEHLARRRR